MFRFFSAIIRGDGAGVADCIVSFASHVPEKGFDIDDFRRDMGETMMQLAEEDLQAGNCMRLVFDTIRKHRITIQPNVMMAAVTMTVLEGSGKRGYNLPSHPKL